MKLVEVPEEKTVHYELQDDRNVLRKLSEIEFASGVAIFRWAFEPGFHNFDDRDVFKYGEIVLSDLDRLN